MVTKDILIPSTHTTSKKTNGNQYHLPVTKYLQDFFLE